MIYKNILLLGVLSNDGKYFDAIDGCFLSARHSFKYISSLDACSSMPQYLLMFFSFPILID